LVIILVLGAKGAFIVTAGTPRYPIAIAVAAPFPVFLAAVWVSSAFRSLVIAIAAASNTTINRILATGAAGEITVAPMAQLPLLVVPAYLVPLSFIRHENKLSGVWDKHVSAELGASSADPSHR
jgi:hypothetical protein